MLDPAGHHNRFEQLRRHFAGRAVPFISHRFSTVREADYIYVLDQGKVAEEGSHLDLMRQDGLYAELFTLQASAYLDSAHLLEAD